MTKFTSSKMLARCTVTARNFAEASENKMHSDATAARYGFRGGLVPGVGMYAYMTIPVVEVWGRDWLDRGTFWAKFLKPVYDGETVTVHAEKADNETIETKVVNGDGVVCAVGEAALPSTASNLDLAAYPVAPSREPEDRWAPSAAEIQPGAVLGSLLIDRDGAPTLGESGNPFIEDVCDPLPIYREADAPLHPAILPAKANTILMANVNLGPWIHTESEVIHFALAKPGENLMVRGTVKDAFEKRGHVFAVLDLAVTGAAGRLLARIVHTAIIKPALAG